MADDSTQFAEEDHFNEWLYDKFGSLRIVKRNAAHLLPLKGLDAMVYGPFKDIAAEEPHHEVNIMFVSSKNYSSEMEIEKTLSYLRKCLGIHSHFFE